MVNYTIISGSVQDHPYKWGFRLIVVCVGEEFYVVNLARSLLLENACWLAKLQERGYLWERPEQEDHSSDRIRVLRLLGRVWALLILSGRNMLPI